MDEHALKALVRDVVERHLGHSAPPRMLASAPAAIIVSHPSHARFRLLSGADLDGPCLIEPAVHCTHCGYCQSHGH
jgi:hypothetical protein